jgi:GAF domain-containing protein
VTEEPADDLARTFAGIARELQAEDTPELVQQRVTRTAVDAVEGCDHAGISLISRHGEIRTVAATDDVPLKVDAVQYEVGQGPCLNAIDQHETFLIVDLATDERWPSFSRRAAAETGVHSMLSFRLFVDGDDGTIGALNLYSRRPGAFDEHDSAVGTILAAHAAIAVQAARSEERADHLEEAVRSNREVGMAMGILMASGRSTQEQAFAALRRASQHLNRKLRDVAADVVETGRLPERRSRGPAA